MSLAQRLAFQDKLGNIWRTKWPIYKKILRQTFDKRTNIPHGRSRVRAFQVPGNSNIWRPPMSQTDLLIDWVRLNVPPNTLQVTSGTEMSQTVIIRSASDYRSLYTIIHSLVDRAYHWRALFRCVNFPPLPKKWVVRSPPYFAQGILGITPKTMKISWKSDD